MPTYMGNYAHFCHCGNNALRALDALEIIFYVKYLLEVLSFVDSDLTLNEKIAE